MKPWIGVTASMQTGNGDLPGTWVATEYTDAILAAGGVPAIVPLGEAASQNPGQWLERLDGLMLTGGVDVDPAYFGEDPARGLGEVCPERDALELALVEAALLRDLPVLAICRGMQVLNVAAGGTLYQDLATQGKNALQHRQRAPRWHGSHRVEIVPGTRLAEILGRSEARVNSFHHQAVRDVAPGMRVAAKSSDGLVEAMESRRHRFAVAVQWHPEHMWRKDPAQMRLFEAFVQAAADGRESEAGE
ncbi:gamma-glutamyl-gamma-aminobutyrate hydrolase family protein [Kyrpidia spormannii]|uniref:Enzyme n=2 Tax=Kyrpidia spormannii TaxID=2055160 RepID=A0ACA8Z4P8_9BACL|nr:gamma-glutamyl-gamma-aminobutyrate hydrolase family protein [Kyrpidia spormannii]CAB3389396.1 putative enzyme [Kyrpidia spormannii]CAB3390078.1 putative enzyme [Kyrpidia spormannii]HHY66694.1 gamma-glutamyl-gamma-aminobutyrate hydrolase family protein [Alicyclobacillus sp.]